MLTFLQDYSMVGRTTRSTPDPGCLQSSGGESSRNSQVTQVMPYVTRIAQVMLSLEAHIEA